MRYFRKYTDSIFSSENINFYEKVQEYKSKIEENERIEFAKEILKKFLFSNSKEEINSNQDIIMKVLNKIENNSFSIDLFDELEYDILNLMKRETYHKFIFFGDEFKLMLKETQNIEFINGKYFETL